MYYQFLGLDFKVHHKKGKDNVVADALSRKENGNVISILIPQWIQDIADMYIGDSKVRNLIGQLALERSKNANFSYQNGVVRYKNQLYVGNQNHYR